jgi:hypothetical protein
MSGVTSPVFLPRLTAKGMSEAARAQVAGTMEERYEWGEPYETEPVNC